MFLNLISERFISLSSLQIIASKPQVGIAPRLEIGGNYMTRPDFMPYYCSSDINQKGIWCTAHRLTQLSRYHALLMNLLPRIMSNQRVISMYLLFTK